SRRSQTERPPYSSNRQCSTKPTASSSTRMSRTSASQRSINCSRSSARTSASDTRTNKECPMAWFVNYYRCPSCGERWCDQWSAQCDDDCPHCGGRHISPYRSENVPPDPVEVL